MYFQLFCTWILLKDQPYNFFSFADLFRAGSDADIFKSQNQIQSLISKSGWNIRDTYIKGNPHNPLNNRLGGDFPFKWERERESIMKFSTHAFYLAIRVDTKFRDAKFCNKKLLSYFAKLLYYLVKLEGTLPILFIYRKLDSLNFSLHRCCRFERIIPTDATAERRRRSN
jgi:hypothetical protein